VRVLLDGELYCAELHPDLAATVAYAGKRREAAEAVKWQGNLMASFLG